MALPCSSTTAARRAALLLLPAVYGATAAQTLVVTFTPSDSQPSGQGGAAAGGAGAGGESSGGEGSGGDSSCCDSALPSDTLVLSEFVDEDCDSGWVEIDNLLLEVYDGSPSGIFRVELGSGDGSCQVNDQACTSTPRSTPPSRSRGRTSPERSRRGTVEASEKHRDW